MAAHLRRLGSLPWRSILRRELPQIARIVVVAAVAWQVCVSLGATQPPVYAVLVPLVSLRDDPFSAFNVSIARLVGVVAGLVIAIGVLGVLRVSTIAIAVILAAALLVGVVLRIGNVLNIQVAVSALLVFSSTDVAGYAVTRLWETGVGTAATLLLAPFLFPADPLKAARAELARAATGLTDALWSATLLVGEQRLGDPEGRSALGAIAADLTQLSADLQILGTRIGVARRSARWTVVRRSAMRATGGLGRTQRLAVRLARHLRAFATEAITLSDRPDIGRDITLRSEHLSRVVRPLESCVTAALTGRPFGDDLERACTAIDDARAQDHTHVSAVLRRPLHSMVEDLQAFATGA